MLQWLINFTSHSLTNYINEEFSPDSFVGYEVIDVWKSNDLRNLKLEPALWCVGGQLLLKFSLMGGG